ncbi:MAG: MFS transporter [Alphaproteobacteria bacterium]|nr:MFS transporter [Alphaproteobacteria bacterium]
MTLPTPSTNEVVRRPVLIAAFCTATVVTLLGGLTWPLLSLRLEAMGYEGTAIGINTASQTVAMVLIAPFVAPLAARFGAVRLMLGAVAGAVVVLLLMAAWDSYVGWMGLRFLLGTCFEILFILADVWVVQLAPELRRGRILAMYMSVSLVGFAMGPLIIDAVGSGGWPPFLAGAACVTLAAVPLFLARRHGPRAEGRRTSSYLGYVRRTPVIMLAGAMYGFIDLIELSLFPVYAVRSGMEEAAVVRVLSTGVLASIGLQLGIGWLSDRIGPWRMLLVCTLLALACAVALPFAIVGWWPTMVVVMMWSGAMGGFFTVGMMLMGQRYGGIDLVAANSVFVVMFGAGSMVGPLAGGAAMDLWDPHGMVAAMVVACLAFLPFILFSPDRAAKRP